MSGPIPPVGLVDVDAPLPSVVVKKQSAQHTDDWFVGFGHAEKHSLGSLHVFEAERERVCVGRKDGGGGGGKGVYSKTETGRSQIGDGEDESHMRVSVAHGQCNRQFCPRPSRCGFLLTWDGCWGRLKAVALLELGWHQHQLARNVVCGPTRTWKGWNCKSVGWRLHNSQRKQEVPHRRPVAAVAAVANNGQSGRTTRRAHTQGRWLLLGRERQGE